MTKKSTKRQNFSYIIIYMDNCSRLIFYPAPFFALLAVYCALLKTKKNHGKNDIQYIYCSAARIMRFKRIGTRNIIGNVACKILQYRKAKTAFVFAARRAFYSQIRQKPAYKSIIRAFTPVKTLVLQPKPTPAKKHAKADL